MRSLLTLFFLLVVTQITRSQSNDFSFGAFSVRDLEAKYYSLDTSAAAIVLNEFGDTYFSEESGNGGIRLVFEYHVRINSEEYYSLKELYAKMVQVQNDVLIFRRNNLK